MQQQTGARSRLMLDIGGYRARAGDGADRARPARPRPTGRRLRRAGRLAPMNPFERKVVHDAIAAIDGVRSESEGEEPQRRVVVLPDVTGGPMTSSTVDTESGRASGGAARGVRRRPSTRASGTRELLATDGRRGPDRPARGAPALGAAPAQLARRSLAGARRGAGGRRRLRCRSARHPARAGPPGPDGRRCWSRCCGGSRS